MTERLVAIPDVARLSARVVRVLGSNPGKFTLQGTNTYLITRPIPSGSPAASSTSPLPSILVDAGEGVEAYEATLEKVLTGKHPESGPHRFHITDIVLTHWHPDHVGGLPSVLSLLSRLRTSTSNGASTSTSLSSSPPRLHKFPDAKNDGKIVERLALLPEGSFTAYKGKEQPLHPLADDDRVGVPAGETSESTSSNLRIVHTPGHTADHVCLLLEEERALLTADHVLGQGTTVFEDLGAYMASLLKCTQLLEDSVGVASQSQAAKELAEGGVGEAPAEWAGPKGEENRLYPAHGPVLENGRATMRQYRAHRLEREEQILALLAKPPPVEEGEDDVEAGRGWTIRSLVAELYSSYPEHLWPAAARGLFLALVKLASPDASVEEGKRSAEGPDGQRVACYDAERGERVRDVKALMPKDERSWLGVMEIRWRLLPTREKGEEPTPMETERL